MFALVTMLSYCVIPKQWLVQKQAELKNTVHNGRIHSPQNVLTLVIDQKCQLFFLFLLCVTYQQK